MRYIYIMVSNIPHKRYDFRLDALEIRIFLNINTT